MVTFSPTSVTRLEDTMKTALTETSVWTEIPEGGVLWDTKTVGLHVRVGRQSRVYYVMTRVKHGKQIRPRIGKVGGIKLREAREKAKQIIAQADDGIDPAEVKRQAIREITRKKRNTFAAMTAQFMGAPERKNLKATTRSQYEAIFAATLLPTFGGMPVKEIDRADVRAWFAEYGVGAPTAANRALFLLRAVLNFAIDEKALEYNVTDRIRKFKESPRERWLDDREIALLWRACDRVAYPAGRIAQLLLLTGQRRLEVGHLRWSEIDPKENIWHLPAERTKTGVANDIPLTPLALKILDACPQFIDVDTVFTSGKNGEKPVAAWSSFKLRIDAAILDVQHEDAKEQGAGPATVEPLERWTFHDLRRSCASILQGLEIPDRTIDRILNHRLPGERKTYNKNPLIKEKTRALQALADHVEAAVIGEPLPDNVIEFSEQR